MFNQKVIGPSYKIRNAKLEDMSYIISLAKNEGWNPGIYDGISFLQQIMTVSLSGSLMERPFLAYLLYGISLLGLSGFISWSRSTGARAMELRFGNMQWNFFRNAI